MVEHYLAVAYLLEIVYAVGVPRLFDRAHECWVFRGVFLVLVDVLPPLAPPPRPL